MSDWRDTLGSAVGSDNDAAEKLRQKRDDERAREEANSKLCQAAALQTVNPALEEVAAQLRSLNREAVVNPPGSVHGPTIAMPRPGKNPVKVSVRLTPTSAGIQVGIYVDAGYFTGSRPFPPGFDGMTKAAVIEAVVKEYQSAIESDPYQG